MDHNIAFCLRLVGGAATSVGRVAERHVAVAECEISNMSWLRRRRELFLHVELQKHVICFCPAALINAELSSWHILEILQESKKCSEPNACAFRACRGVYKPPRSFLNTAVALIKNPWFLFLKRNGPAVHAVCAVPRPKCGVLATHVCLSVGQGFDEKTVTKARRVHVYAGCISKALKT